MLSSPSPLTFSYPDEQFVIAVSESSPPHSPALGADIAKHVLTEHKKVAPVIDLTDDGRAEAAPIMPKRITSRPGLSPIIIKPIVSLLTRR